jgi:hypothetical protein
MRGSASQLSPASDDDTLTEGASLLQHRTISIDDWSQTGRGSHVEFNDGENVLLKPGQRKLICVYCLLITHLKAAFLGEAQWETSMKLPFKATGSLSNEW